MYVLSRLIANGVVLPFEINDLMVGTSLAVVLKLVHCPLSQGPAWYDDVIQNL